MPEPLEFSDLAKFHTLGDQPVPEVVLAMTEGDTPDLVWRNELGGLTFRTTNRYIKWNPKDSGIDLDREHERLRWLAGRHPVPRVLRFGQNATEQWLLTEAVPGEHAVGDTWRERRSEAIAAIALGLRELHAIPIDDFPQDWIDDAWPNQRQQSLGTGPPIEDFVVVHGDACAPNTLISEDGVWTGNVDFGDLTLSDRWADLAIASMSLDWNFGEGHQSEFFDAYGIDPDPERIVYYRGLWDLGS